LGYPGAASRTPPRLSHVSINSSPGMTLEHLSVDTLFQLIVFLFAISIHESAHAWMANRCGDPTARMLGRITLNPIKHIDPVGTILLPLIALITGIPMLGWAKPTPVDPRNFRNPVRDDIKTSVVGPLSNFVVASGALVVLATIGLVSRMGAGFITEILDKYPHLDTMTPTKSLLMPLCLLVYEMLFINVLLGVFNLIPVPPLDGSHVIRHVLPEPALRAYDAVGWLGLLALIYFGGGLLWRLISPVLRFFEYILVSIIAAH
jgi:Zn-dependent protease